MERKLRILIVTDSPVMPTGLAETTRLIFSTLLDKYPEQYELHQVGICHCYAVTKPRWPIYPTQAVQGPNGLRWLPEDGFGQKTYPEVLAKVQPDIVFGLRTSHSLTVKGLAVGEGGGLGEGLDIPWGVHSHCDGAVFSWKHLTP